MTRASLSYLKATFWNELVIDLKSIDMPTNPTTIADYLRYYRKLYNISRRQLEVKVNIPMNSIKSYEDKDIYPTREVSIKLAQFFNLDTKYFYDPFYENSLDIINILKKYRGNNTYVSVAKKVGVHAHTWRDWENGKYFIKRENFYKLKRLRIIP
ncbi:helix-turn-helix transcriptional regulator [Clostridium sp. NSJ-6]|uniref:Helix-turn-helix transcriptional regulator n=1 Tax=Clostridium hominis TaxID=2763036 RepID=A0ABR7DGV5_9CLOT|nr:helix-turn-helix transcriptional regulator [Clostridium hominis]